MTDSAPKIIVFGKNGQVGGEIASLTKNTPKNFIFVAREDVDLTNKTALQDYLNAQTPDAIINAAAYTAVDKAESDSETAFAVNATAPAAMAKYAAKRSIPFIHISTDYVFDGAKDGAYTEDDPINPLGVYGASKADGEKAVLDSGAHAVIFRTSWVYAENGQNFVHTMLRLGQERDTLNIVSDQIGAPTNARDIASALLNVLEQVLESPSDKRKCGIFNLVNGGETSWHGFAEFIFDVAKEYGLKTPQNIGAIPSSDYPTPAKRPLNSRLDGSKTYDTFGIKTKHWEDSARACLDTILKEHGKAKAS